MYYKGTGLGNGDVVFYEFFTIRNLTIRIRGAEGGVFAKSIEFQMF